MIKIIDYNPKTKFQAQSCSGIDYVKFSFLLETQKVNDDDSARKLTWIRVHMPCGLDSYMFDSPLTFEAKRNEDNYLNEPGKVALSFIKRELTSRLKRNTLDSENQFIIDSTYENGNQIDPNLLPDILDFQLDINL